MLSSPRLWRPPWRRAFDQPVQQREHHRAERQAIDPPAALGEERLLQFQPQHAADLAHPELVHTVASLGADQVLIDGIHVVIGRRHRFHFQAGIENHAVQQQVEAVGVAWCAAAGPCRRRCILASTTWSCWNRRAASMPGRSQRTRICMGCSFTSLRTPWIWPFGHHVALAQQDHLVGDAVHFVQDVAGDDDVAALVAPLRGTARWFRRAPWGRGRSAARRAPAPADRARWPAPV